MLTRCNLIMVLLLTPASPSDAASNPCEIPSVEAGDDATFTIRFREDVSKDQRDFYLNLRPRVKRPGLYDERMLKCTFDFGNVSCSKTGCCSWERQVKDVFRVYIHNVSQEHEGTFWGTLMPSLASTDPCNFTLKASTCSKDSINAINSQVVCSAQSITIGQTCTVTCNSDISYQGNQSSVTYTCVGKSKWSPEVPTTSCEASTLQQATSRLSTPDFFISPNSNDQTTDFSTTVSTHNQANSLLSTLDLFASSNSSDQTIDFSKTVSTLHQTTSRLSTPDFTTSSFSNDQTKDFSTTVSTLHQTNSHLSTPDFFTSSNSIEQTKDFPTTVSTLPEANSRVSTPDFIASSNSNDQTKDFSTTVSTLHQANSRLSTTEFFTSSYSNDQTKDLSTTVTTHYQTNSHLSTPDFFTSSNSNDQTKDFSTTEKRNGTSIIKVLGSVIVLLVAVAIVSVNY